MFKIKVLGISGSPRKGNSDFLLTHALKGAKDVDPDYVAIDSVSFKGKKMNPCLSCLKCMDNGGNCVIKDDFQELRNKWVDADAVIYSVPVYHMGIPGQMKCFFDRLSNSAWGFYRLKPRRLKIIGSLAQGEDIFAGQESCKSFLLIHAALTNCLAVSGDGPEAYIGAGGWTRHNMERNALKKLYENGEEDAAIAVKASTSVGRRVVEVAMIVKAGVYACKDKFKDDPYYQHLLKKIEGEREER